MLLCVKHRLWYMAVSPETDSKREEMKSEQKRSPVIAAVYGAVAGAIYGGIAGMLMPPLVRPCFQVLGAQLRQAQCAHREFSAFTAALFGFESITKGKDDLMARLVSASGVGLVYSFVKQGLKVRPAHALSYAAAFTVMSGTMFKMNKQSPGERLLIRDHTQRYGK